MTAIIIITYNIRHDIFTLQMNKIQQHCTDEFKIIVIDNSTEENQIKEYCEEYGIEFHKTSAVTTNDSLSHSFAANTSYRLVKDRFDYLFYLDHDCIPVKDFSVKEILNGNIMAGIAQQKSKLYLWPGCLMIDNDKIDKSLVDFSPSVGLDTGGELHRIIDAYGNSAIGFFDEAICQIPACDEPIYNYYTMICKGTFLHFINASGWNVVKDNEARLNLLFSIAVTMK
jgi:glycosyltransferase involved in cell wall biosynthesis